MVYLSQNNTVKYKNILDIIFDGFYNRFFIKTDKEILAKLKKKYEKFKTKIETIDL